MIDSVAKGRKILKYSPAEFSKFVILVAQLCGVNSNSLPDKNSCILLFDFVIRQHGAMTDEELKTAFTLYAAGELDAEEHYQNFSAKFFSSVVNAYKKYANRVINYAERIREEPVQLEVNKEADWTEVVSDLKEKAKVKGVDKLIIPLPVYDWLVKTEAINPTVEEKKAAFDWAKKEISAELALKMMSGDEKAKFEHEELKTLNRNSSLYVRVANRAKTNLVKKYLS